MRLEPAVEVLERRLTPPAAVTSPQRSITAPSGMSGRPGVAVGAGEGVKPSRAAASSKLSTRTTLAFRKPCWPLISARYQSSPARFLRLPMRWARSWRLTVEITLPSFTSGVLRKLMLSLLG